jgi:putative ABC transport system permease protein
MTFTFVLIAIKNLTRNRRRSLFTLGAIFFGIAIVLILKGVADGFLNMTIEGVMKSRIGAIQIHKKGFMDNLAGNPVGLNFELTSEFESQIMSVKHVTGLAPRVNFSGTISNGKTQTIIFGTGIKPSAELQVCPLAPSIIVDGRGLNNSDENEIIVGVDLANSLKLKVGTESNVTLSGASPEGRQNALDATILGTATALNSLAELRFITVPLKMAQDLTGLDGRITEVAISVDEMTHINSVKADLKKVLGDEYEVIDWQEAQPFIRDVVFRQKVIISIVSAVLFIMVMFLVGNTMLMTVHERTREIGTMLAVGVKQSQILWIFIFEALILGVVGGVLGAILGVTANAVMSINGVAFTAVFQKTLLYPSVTTEFTAWAIVAACICTVIAGFIPALKASNLNPVDALRG